jgi:uncharacterized protein YjdB
MLIAYNDVPVLTGVAVAVLPTNATNKSLTWSSSDTRVFRVSRTGLITAVRIGSAFLNVRSVNGNKSDSIRVNIVR